MSLKEKSIRLEGFEDFLREEHSKEYAGTDDEMQDDYEAWLTNLDNEELIDYGNKAIQEQEQKIKQFME